mmetsp:Transcript_34592/g.78867  ORF Transcript_34592/g.78867 Transcript_34592/m.78867 type:complete len:201 (-) Transcript_34592:1337-1939(-)
MRLARQSALIAGKTYLARKLRSALKSRNVELTKRVTCCHLPAPRVKGLTRSVGAGGLAGSEGEVTPSAYIRSKKASPLSNFALPCCSENQAVTSGESSTSRQRSEDSRTRARHKLSLWPFLTPTLGLAALLGAARDDLSVLPDLTTLTAAIFCPFARVSSRAPRSSRVLTVRSSTRLHKSVCRNGRTAFGCSTRSSAAIH